MLLLPAVLTDKNFILYAAQNYHNPCCNSVDEFNEDIRRIKYLKKLVTRYIQTGELRERLILNHIIVLSNIFDPETLCRILFLKMEPQFGYIKPFLLALNILIDKIINVKNERVVDTSNIVMDEQIIGALRRIFTNVQ